MSLGARGTIAKTLTAQSPRGIDRIISTPTHADALTHAQLTQRARLSSAVAFWRQLLTDAQPADAWDRYAAHTRAPFRGYAAAQRAIVKAQSITNNPSFAWLIVPDTGYTATAILFDVGTHAQATEPGDFTIYAGSSPASMHPHQTTALDGGGISVSALATRPETVYLQIFKDGIPRSGLARLEVEIDPMPVNLTVNNLTIAGNASLAGTGSGWQTLDPSSVQTTIAASSAQLTKDTAWHDRDISHLVPVGTKWIAGYTECAASVTHAYWALGPGSGTGYVWYLQGRTSTAGVYGCNFFLIPLDSSRRFGYLIQNTTWYYWQILLGAYSS
jgi:hypothetical protein